MSTYTSLKNKRVELLTGIIVGFLVSVLLFLIITSLQKEKTFKHDTVTNVVTKIDTVNVGNYTLQIKEQSEVSVKENNAIIEERMNSFNARITDLYTSLAIVLTLILIIIGGLYIKTENEVTNHMNENFAKYKESIINMNTEALTMVNQIKTQWELSEQIMKSNTSKANQTPTDDNNGNS